MDFTIKTSNGNVISFPYGTPTIFRASRNFSLPNPIQGGMNISIRRGEPITFDGSLFSYGHIVQQALPQFLGAIRSNWVVLAADYQEDVVEAPTRAPIRVGPTELGNPMVDKPRQSVAMVHHEEREVHSFAPKQASQVGRPARESYSGFNSTVERQDGVIVREVAGKVNNRNASRHNPVDVSEVNLIAVEKNLAINSAKGILESNRAYAGKTKGRLSVLLSKPVEEREEYLERLDRQISGTASQLMQKDPAGAQRFLAKWEEERAELAQAIYGDPADYDLDPELLIAKKAPAKKGPKTAKKTAPKAAGKPAKVAVHVDAPAPKGDDTFRRKMAKALCPDFPDNYDFSAPLKRKIARIMADYSDRYDVIRAAVAAEDDVARAALAAEFPEAFE